MHSSERSQARFHLRQPPLRPSFVQRAKAALLPYQLLNHRHAAGDGAELGEATRQVAGAEETEALDALVATWTVLRSLVEELLAPGLRSLCGRRGSTAVMDVFYYPEMPGQWMACCKHTDPGLITVVVADTAGLEVHRDHAWVPANAELPSAAAMIGEEWANAYFLQAVPLPACQPCLHQVQLKGASRVSIAFEMRLSPEGREQLLRAQEVLYSDPVQKPKTNCTCFPPVSMFVGRARKCCYKGS